MKNNGLLPTPEMSPAMRRITIELDNNSRTVLEKRYLRRGRDGKPIETIEEMFWRVAYHVANAKRAEGTTMAKAEEYFTMLMSKDFFPNSPTFTGAGTPLGQLAACFVIPISDDMGKRPTGIFTTLRNAALVQQTGGGNGFSFSRLRPANAFVYSSGGSATGPLGFMRVFDKAFGEVSQGGARRGANMAVLNIEHPDIEDFIRCKAKEGDISNFNISVGITDAFMRAVEQDGEFELRFPDIDDERYREFDGTLNQAIVQGLPIKTYKKVKARELFAKIVKFAHHNGEPGILFMDAMNRTNPVPHVYEIESTNPCVTADTWVLTTDGPQKVADLIGRPFQAIVNGREFTSDPRGFWSTGNKPVLRLKTTDGRSIRLTANHRVLTVTASSRNNEKTEWVEAGDLIPGSKIKIHDHRQRIEEWGGDGNEAEGWLLGLLVGDGSFRDDRAILSFWGGEEASHMANTAKATISGLYPTRSDFSVTSIVQRNEYRVSTPWIIKLASRFGIAQGNKVITDAVEKSSRSFYMGFLMGLFDADGSVQDAGEKGVSVRLSQSNIDNLERAQRMLLRLGINSTVYPNRREAGFSILPNGKGSVQSYATSAQHELVISKENLRIFAALVGFSHAGKASLLTNAIEERGSRGLYREDFTTEVAEIVPETNEEVFDCSIPEVNAFDANGFVVHNCGEQALGPFESCCLGSVNLSKHLKGNKVDWAKIRKTVYTSVQFLDDVIDANGYVPGVPQIREAALNSRRIGLGIMGLADMMYAVGIRYGSEEGQDFASQLMEFIRFHAMMASIDLANTLEPFPMINGSVYDPKNMTWEAPKPVTVHGALNIGRPNLDWNQVVEGIRKHGIRNSAQTTVAPTGTISTVAGCEGYGCEPVFALAYVRHVNDNGKDLELTYASPLFESALGGAGFSAEEMQVLIGKVAAAGTCKDVSEVPSKIRNTFVTAGDLTPEEHVYMQAALQAWVDNQISKTVNFPDTATEEDVEKAYRLAWKMGCKGLTVYVAGSRDKVVLETKKVDNSTAEQKVDAPKEVVVPGYSNIKRSRPKILTGVTVKGETPLGDAYVTVNEAPGDGPFEVFITTAKAGSDISGISEALARLISYILRMPSPISPMARLKEVIRQLRNIGGSRSMGFGPNRVVSLPDGIARAMNEYVENKEAPAQGEEFVAEPPSPIFAEVAVAFAGHNGNGHHAAEHMTESDLVTRFAEICPECGTASLLNESGCRHCVNCKHSDC